MIRRTVKYTEVKYYEVYVDESGEVVRDSEENTVVIKGNVSKEEVRKRFNFNNADVVIKSVIFKTEKREMPLSIFIKYSYLV